MDLAQLPDDLHGLCVNTLRFLAIDAVEKAKSGHPGLPMGAAEMAFTLWSRFHLFDPADPTWINRDRFVLSAGHGSMLLYGLLYMYGYDLSLDDLKQFRQWGSRTPGHPENVLTPGIEVTTGPLGQGFAHGVGLALASKHLAARFNTPEHALVTSRVWGIVSDGDLMEGISAEAASLAGHLKLDNLVYLYDSNRITIDGSTDLTFTENVKDRFAAYDWYVDEVNGLDSKAVAAALERASRAGRPALILCHTTIGYGSPNKAGTPKAHGSPLGPDETEKTRENLGWPEQTFYVPEAVRPAFAQRVQENQKAHAEWSALYAAWRVANPDKAREWDRLFALPPDDLEQQLVSAAGEPGLATRAIGGKVINKVAELVPGLMGGSADLDESTNTFLKASTIARPGEYGGRNVHFGIREHAMVAAMNGLSMFGGLRGFTATFLVFSDYARPSIRLAALEHAPSVFVFTHDSVFLGEDGPTHQPIEQLWALRLIPNLEVWRPADPREVALAWAGAMRRKHGPTLIVLTRQKLEALPGHMPHVPQNADDAAAYIAHEPDGRPDAILIATGSETAITIEAAKMLASDGKRIRVVSMPSVNRFLERSDADREKLLPHGVPTGAVEAGVTAGWRQFTGRDGLVIGIDTFGHSAPAPVIAQHLGFTPVKIAERVKAWLK